MNDTVHRYLRQTIAALVALSLFLSVFGPVGTVAADPSVSVEQTADSTTVEPGETVTLTTEFDVEELNSPQLSVTTPDSWEITEQSAEGPVSYKDGTWQWLAGEEDGINASYTVEYTVSVPEDASEGEYSISVEGSALAPDDFAKTVDSDSTTITVEVPDQNEDPSASFTVSPSSPEVGETVSFDASDSSDADGSIASYEWDFGDGETATGATPTHTYDSPGDYDVALTVTDDDGATDTATQTVSVSEAPDPANFQVSNLDAPDSATQGENITVSADVTNEGDEEATQTVEFRLDLDGNGSLDGDEALTTQEVTLDGGETQTVNFSDLDTSGLDAGDYDHGVFTDNDSATATITIEAPEPGPANFEVSNLDAPDSATQGDTINVSADVENTGGQAANQTVEFRVDVDGDGFDEDDDVVVPQDVQLDPGQSTTVEFTDINTSDLPADTFAHGVVTENDSATAQITITEPTEANFQVSDLSPTNVTVTKGDIIDVSATVENTGGQTATETVEFRVDGTPLANQTIELDPGESTTVTFEGIDTSGLEPGEYMHGVFTPDDSATATLTVEAEGIPPVGDFNNSPTDPDGDGLYEDINGDGEFNIVDVQALFANLDDETVQNNVDEFDFNEDGKVDVVDVQKLFTEFTEVS